MKKRFLIPVGVVLALLVSGLAIRPNSNVPAKLGLSGSSYTNYSASDGNHTPIKRTTAATGVAPTAAEVANPANGDSASILLTSGKEEMWERVSGSWVFRYVNVGAAVEKIIDFSVNTNPNNAGTSFTPAQPQDPDVIYFSTIDSSIWKWNGNAYVTYVPPPANDWKTIGNLGTVQATNFLGTKDNVGLSIRTNNVIQQQVQTNGDIKFNAYPTARLSTAYNSVLGNPVFLADGTIGYRKKLKDFNPVGTGNVVYAPDLDYDILQAVSFNNNGVIDFTLPNDGFQGQIFIAKNISANFGAVYKTTNSSMTNDLVLPANTGSAMWIHDDVRWHLVGGNGAPKLDFIPSSGGTTIVQPNQSAVEIGSGNPAHTVTLPSASAFNGRSITVKLAGNTTGTIVTVNSAGGQVESTQGTLGASAILQYGFRSGIWQSDGTNWQLTAGNTDGIHLANVSSLLLGGVIPDGYNVYQDFNGSHQTPVSLPVNGGETGQVFTFRHLAGFDTSIRVANTSMATPLLVTAAMGGASWVWNGTKWNLIG